MTRPARPRHPCAPRAGRRAPAAALAIVAALAASSPSPSRAEAAAEASAGAMPMGGAFPAVPAGGSCYRLDVLRTACYARPRSYDFVLEAPGNIGRFVGSAFRRENALWVAGIVASTAGFLMVDQDLVHGARDASRELGISATGKQKDIIPGIPVQYPTDLGSTLYYIGDGMVPAVILTGVLGYGLFTSDDRALQTSSHLAQGLLSTAIVVQTVKRVTGRQTPIRATEPGGKWQPFTDQRVYQKNVPNYDAFPSGHVATAMVTITVLAENYPEYWLIRPVGYALMVPLGFQMLNNGVHWASDYPLALAIGYGLGKQAVSHGRRVVSSADPDAATGRPGGPEVTIVPLPLEGGGGVAAVGRF